MPVGGGGGGGGGAPQRRVLLMDEPSADLDEGTDKELQKRLHERQETLLCIVHRPKNLKFFDLVMELDLDNEKAGKLAYFGEWPKPHAQ